MKTYQQIFLDQTCGACPEQYDAYFNNELIGYLRLRHGYFRAEHNGVIVYEAYTIGDGIFDDSERDFHLNQAKKSIFNSVMFTTQCLKGY